MKGERQKWPKTYYLFKGENGLAVGKLVLKLEHFGFSQGHPFLTVVEFLRLRFHRSSCRSWYSWWWHHPSIGLTSCHHWLGSFKKTTCHFLTYFLPWIRIPMHIPRNCKIQKDILLMLQKCGEKTTWDENQWINHGIDYLHLNWWV